MTPIIFTTPVKGGIFTIEIYISDTQDAIPIRIIQSNGQEVNVTSHFWVTKDGATIRNPVNLKFI